MKQKIKFSSNGLTTANFSSETMSANNNKKNPLLENNLKLKKKETCQSRIQYISKYVPHKWRQNKYTLDNKMSKINLRCIFLRCIHWNYRGKEIFQV